MEKVKMYFAIHELKNIGLKKSQIARKLEVNIKTVTKYLSMDPETFQNSMVTERAHKLSAHKDLVLSWLREYPDIRAAQVMDWLKEHYSLQVSERSTRRFVERIRKEHNIPKSKSQRQYQAVVDPPMGMQMQVDFGETYVRDAYQSRLVKLYVMGVVLSNSRYKYGVWLDKPFTTPELIKALRWTFEYIEGVPKELVFDQDKLVAVGENHGDIIYTFEFQKFKKEVGFEVRLCRAADPESKGKIEAVVKYMKNNFAKNRLYMGLDVWNMSFEEWLIRTANAKPHGTTKKIPAEVFALEQQYLKPIPNLNYEPSEIIVTRNVRKDNTILYKSNRYSLPLGTYKLNADVQIEEIDGILKIYDPIDHIPIAEHKVSLEKGALIQNNNHLRDTTEKINKLYEKVLSFLGNTSNAEVLLKQIRELKSRYVRDQYKLIETTVEKYPFNIINQAVDFCVVNRLYSAVEFRDAAAYFLSKENEEPEEAVSVIDKRETMPDYMDVKTERRSISAYTELAGGDANE